MSNITRVHERPCRTDPLQPDCRQTATWTAVECALTDRFHPKESRQVHISTLRAKLRRPDEDLHQLRCDISRLVEMAYPHDLPDILNRTARDFFVGALTPIILGEKVLDLGPNTGAPR